MYSQELALDLIAKEADRAAKKFPIFNSAHEGYAVLLEEVEELWDEIKLKSADRDDDKMLLEAVQVGAMAVRFITDIIKIRGKVQS